MVSNIQVAYLTQEFELNINYNYTWLSVCLWAELKKNISIKRLTEKDLNAGTSTGTITCLLSS